MSRLAGGIRQLGMVVRDADAAMRHWSERCGVGPFFVIRRLVFEDYRYRGEPAPAPEVTLCFASSGPLQIELIEQHNDAPSAYTEFLARGGEGCQHVSAWFSRHEDYDAAYRRLSGNGLVCVHEACTRAVEARFAYFETGLPGGLMFELAEATLPALAPLAEKIEAVAADWDGREPVRPYG